MPADTIMTDGLYRLLTWLSPSFPVGAYAFSHGLEYAIESGQLRGAEAVHNWISDLVSDGDGQADLVFLSAAWRAAHDIDELRAVHELALAFQPTSEIVLETTAQGDAFISTIESAWPCDAVAIVRDSTVGPVAYPVVVGVVARIQNIALLPCLQAYGHAFVSNLVSAAVRIVPLGQTEGQQITAALQRVMDGAIERALDTAYVDVSSSCPMAEIASMQHETQYTRLFRS